MNIVISILGEPKNLQAKRYQTTSVKLTWIKGINSETTIIVRKEGSYPDNVNDGTLIYNDTGNVYVDSPHSEKHYYYRAWSYLKGYISEKYSQDNIVLGKKIYIRKPAEAPPILPEEIKLEEFKLPVYFILIFVSLILIFFFYLREEEKEDEPSKRKKPRKEKKENKEKKKNWFLALFEDDDEEE